VGKEIETPEYWNRLAEEARTLEPTPNSALPFARRPIQIPPVGVIPLVSRNWPNREGEMRERLETARLMRVGAERLRKLAGDETDPKMAADMLDIAVEMDQHAAEIERSLTTPSNASPASASPSQPS